MTDVRVALVEPVGSHGGMDYYDSGLAAALTAKGIPTTWYTCNGSVVRGSRHVAMQTTFTNVWGSDPAWKRGLRYIASLGKTFVAARKNHENIAHFHMFHVGALEFLGVLMARLAGLRVVITVHDVEAFRPGFSSEIIMSMTYKLCSIFIVHNEVSKQELSSKKGVLEKNIRVIPHGSYLGLVDAPIPRGEAKTSLGVSPEEIVILFFGQIKEVKGLELLIEAVGKIQGKVQNIKLMIAGKVWKDDFSKYQALINQYELSQLVHLDIRYIPDQEISKYYSAADLIVLPYKKIYQSGVLLMAMSFGTLVLASDLPGMKQVITDGKNGYLFNSGNSDDLAAKILHIFSQPDFSKIVGQAQEDMRSRFSWDAISTDVVRAYQDALS